MKIYVIIIAAFLLKPLNAQDMYNLESCETDIATDVPQFFQDFFQCVTARMSTIGDDGRQYVNIYFDSQPPYQTWYYDASGVTESNHPNWIPFQSTTNIDAMTPGVITELDLVISIPVNPGSDLNPPRDLTINGDLVDGEVGTSNYEYPMGTIGSALNGVTMFNPCAAPGDIIENEASTFDLYNGHPTGGNIYHYHTNSPGPLEVLAHKMPDVVTNTAPGSAEIEVFGINCDGVVVLGCTELDGSAVDPTEWDAQNGHVHDMVGADGTVYFAGRYHTHICYTDITDEDTDGDSPNDNYGYDQHEFTPEISYYETPGYAGLGGNQTGFDRCVALSDPVLPDNGWVALDDNVLIPGEFSLYNNYPNPFNPTTVLDYDIPENSFVNITVYDMMGRRVKTLVNANQSAGFKSIQWNATNNAGHPVSAGLYLYTIDAGGFKQTKKMVLLK